MSNLFQDRRFDTQEELHATHPHGATPKSKP